MGIMLRFKLLLPDAQCLGRSEDREQGPLPPLEGLDPELGLVVATSLPHEPEQIAARA